MTVAVTNDLRRAGFPFRSGRLCLDFVATVAKRGIADREMLTGPAALRTWLHVAGLPAAQDLRDTDLDRVRELREAVHALTRRHVDGVPPDPAVIETINAAAVPGTPPAFLGSDGRTLLPPGQAPLDGILATLARDTIDLFGGPLRHRVRACIGHDCSLFFVDRSRPGTRRWCTMAACGEKASSAAYRKRHPAKQ